MRLPSGLPAESFPFHCAMVLIAVTAGILGVWPAIALPVAGSGFMFWCMWMLDA